MEIEPQLDACVETQAKREYNQLVRQLLEKDAGTELTEKVEILRLFLESADFNKLRAESEKHLLAGRKVKFVVHLDRGQPKYEMKIV
jgi:hypothetical protein